MHLSAVQKQFIHNEQQIAPITYDKLSCIFLQLVFMLNYTNISSASEVTTIWRYTNVYIIIIIISF